MQGVADFPVLAIGASAGGLEAVRRITEALPRNCGAAVALVVHVGRLPSQLPEILNWHGKLPATFAEEGAVLEPGRIYVAPPDRHMLLEVPGRIHLDDGTPVHHTRPAVDPLFASAAATFGQRESAGSPRLGSRKLLIAGNCFTRPAGGYFFRSDSTRGLMSALTFAKVDMSWPSSNGIGNAAHGRPTGQRRRAGRTAVYQFKEHSGQTNTDRHRWD